MLTTTTTTTTNHTQSPRSTRTMSSEENGNFWEDSGTSGIKPELSCPFGAQWCFTQDVRCQQGAANYKNVCVSDHEGSLSLEPLIQPAGHTNCISTFSLGREPAVPVSGSLQPQLLTLSWDKSSTRVRL